MDVSTQIDATNLSSQPTAPAMGQAIPQNHFSLMVGQLRAHSLHPDYLPHSTTIPIPHSTSPTPPPIYRGCSRRQCPRTPRSRQTRSNDLVLTTTLAGGRTISVSMLCSFMDSLYFYGLLALGGLCAHLYEYPPTNSTLSPIWAPTVRRDS